MPDLLRVSVVGFSFFRFIRADPRQAFAFPITAMSLDHGDDGDLLVYQYVKLTLSSHTE